MGTETKAAAEPVFYVDGRPVRFRIGEPVATALLAAGIRHLRNSPVEEAPRGAFCFMGVCQECVALIDGEQRQTCLVDAQPGMRISLATSP